MSAIATEDIFKWYEETTPGLSPSPCLMLDLRPYDLRLPERPGVRQHMLWEWEQKMKNGGCAYD